MKPHKVSGVAAFSGKWLDSWPGMKSKGGYDPGPYADEKPLFTITAQNMAQYADKLTDSQKGMFQHFPNAFRMLHSSRAGAVIARAPCGGPRPPRPP